jgi:hypothetical protein
MPFWFEDERQVYLIGLQSFARGEWPYFGADVVWTGGQVPGALLGWLIRLPLAMWPAPESPIVFPERAVLCGVGVAGLVRVPAPAGTCRAG